MLFRAGMRTVADLRGKTVGQLLAMDGIGPKSASVVQVLAD
ncbi:MAG: hypothetical protein AB7O97_02880 [Planctomycetota bacterium]